MAMDKRALEKPRRITNPSRSIQHFAQRLCDQYTTFTTFLLYEEGVSAEDIAEIRLSDAFVALLTAFKENDHSRHASREEQENFIYHRVKQCLKKFLDVRSGSV